MMKFLKEAGLVNFVCIVFELGDKMLTLSSLYGKPNSAMQPHMNCIIRKTAFGLCEKQRRRSAVQ